MIEDENRLQKLGAKGDGDGQCLRSDCTFGFECGVCYGANIGKSKENPFADTYDGSGSVFFYYCLDVFYAQGIFIQRKKKDVKTDH